MLLARLSLPFQRGEKPAGRPRAPGSDRTTETKPGYFNASKADSSSAAANFELWTPMLWSYSTNL
jgi:hypothetical protein